MVTLPAEYTASTGFLILAYIAIAALAMLVLVSLFGPGLGYKIAAGNDAANDSEVFLHTLETLVDANVCRNTQLTVLTNGRRFYEDELAVIYGKLGGTCVLGERWEIVNGEFIPDGTELSTHKILEASVSGKKLLLTIAGNKIGSSEVVPVELTLIGVGQAEGRVVAGPNSTEETLAFPAHRPITHLSLRGWKSLPLIHQRFTDC